MSLKTLKAAILHELHTVSGNGKLRPKDILKWSSGEITVQDGETLYLLPALGVRVLTKASPTPPMRAPVSPYPRVWGRILGAFLPAHVAAAELKARFQNTERLPEDVGQRIVFDPR